MNIKKKKGFTLIELMIVLAIIAILAVVLIPKSAIFKGQSRNAGVTTNVNTVRAYLETKVTDSSGNPGYLSADDLKTAFTNSFTFTVSGSGSGGTSAPYSLIPGNDTGKETITNPVTSGSVSIVITDSDTSLSLTDGSVVIIATGSGGYTVYGVDNGGNKMQQFTIK